ncbi:MAG TPA: hypothetical protein VED37_11770 [Ktedonobacteraceae bacterium]|nr:hypothetical protein [Ktedonobacteraceae bacterium]
MDTSMSTATKSIKPSSSDSFKRFFGGVHFKFPQFKHDHPAIMDVKQSWM